MTWFRVDDEWFCHPKVMGLGLAARGLWVTAGSWCANRLTDGFVPTAALSRFGATKRHAAELVSAGLWTEVENGYQFWDWLEFQPSKEKVLDDRKATLRRVSKHRNTVTPSVTNSVGNGVSNARVTPPPVPDPVPTLFSSENSLSLSTSETTHARAREGVGWCDQEFDSRGLEALFSRLRKGSGGGTFRAQRSDYDRSQKAVEWAREETPADPASACERSIRKFLLHATGKEGDGWPFWGWANDPGKWLAYTPPKPGLRPVRGGMSQVSSAEDFAADAAGGNDPW